MEITLSKDTAKGLRKCIEFTLCAIVKDKEDPSKGLDTESLKVLGISTEQAYRLLVLDKQLKNKVK